MDCCNFQSCWIWTSPVGFLPCDGKIGTSPVVFRWWIVRESPGYTICNVRQVYNLDIVVYMALAQMIRRLLSILGDVGQVFTFWVAFLLLRIKFMHSSLSQTGLRFIDSSLLSGVVLLAMLVRCQYNAR